jgi:hypothetical protein
MQWADALSSAGLGRAYLKQCATWKQDQSAEEDLMLLAVCFGAATFRVGHRAKAGGEVTVAVGVEMVDLVQVNPPDPYNPNNSNSPNDPNDPNNPKDRTTRTTEQPERPNSPNDANNLIKPNNDYTTLQILLTRMLS